MEVAELVVEDDTDGLEVVTAVLLDVLVFVKVVVVVSVLGEFAFVLNSRLQSGATAVSGENRNTVSTPAISDVICIEKLNVPLEEVSLG